jgi:hypothetical protein
MTIDIDFTTPAAPLEINFSFGAIEPEDRRALRDLVTHLDVNLAYAAA